MNDSPRRLLAIMFSDIVGYSRMMGADEKLALALVEEHNALMLPLIAANHGKALKFIGDAILSSFESASDAVRCAVAIQRALKERNARTDETRRILVRIGIHVGEIAEKGGDVFGDGVNIAARVEPLAEPGGVCVTQTVYQMVRAQKELPMEPLGERRLKNIADPIALYRVLTGAEVRTASKPGARVPKLALAAVGVLAAGTCLWLARGRFSRPPESAAPDAFAVAVAPFYGRDAESAKDGQAMQALIEQKLNGLFGPKDGVSVLASAIGKAPRNRDEAKFLADKVGANAVIWGEVIHLDGGSEIQPYLTDGSFTGSYWEQFSPQATQSQVEGTDQLALHRMKTSQAASLAILAAAEFYGTRNPLKALALLAKIDPEGADTCAAAGYLYITLKRLDDADRMFHRALGFDPKHARAYNGVGTVLRLRGRFQDAAVQFQKAIDLKPDYPGPYFNLGMIDEAQGRDEAAEVKYRQILTLNAGLAMARFRLANLLEKRGRYADAADEYRRLVERFGKPRFVAFDALFCALALERAGKHDESAAWVKGFLKKARAGSGDDAAWPLPFLRYLGGEITLEALTRSADDADPEVALKRQCDLGYYLGALSLVRSKDPAAARAYFEKALATKLETRMEYQRAKGELARLAK